jgi:hypothetical protein
METTAAVVDDSSAVADDLTAEQYLSLADASLVDEEYGTAVDAYAAGLTVVRKSVTDFRIRSHRSAAFFHLGRYEEALQDAVAASGLLPLAGLRPGEAEAVARRQGLGAFHSHNKDGEAKMAFEKAAQLATLNQRDATVYHEYIRKCQARQQKHEPTNDRASSSSAASVPAVSAAAAVSVSAASAAATAAVSVPAASATAASAAPPPPPPPPPAAAPTTTTATTTTTTTTRPTAPPKYQYYQNDKFMTISILEPNVQREDLQVDMEAKQLTIVLTKATVQFPLICGHLYDEIAVDTSRIQIKPEKVLIKLRKTRLYEWPELLSKPELFKKKNNNKPTTTTATETATTETKKTPIATPYASHRDWDSIEKTIAEEEANEKPVGDEAMNQLFQTIYAKADEDTRRAMIKSYQTSGGTVLSTNWKEVGGKDYEKERTAPKGMEWKTWDGDKVPAEED